MVWNPSIFATVPVDNQAFLESAITDDATRGRICSGSMFVFSAAAVSIATTSALGSLITERPLCSGLEQGTFNDLIA